jgi:sorting nexin-4
MAVLDQDNFSNISWHSERNSDAPGPSTSTANNDPSHNPEHSGSRPDGDRTGVGTSHDPGHTSGEILECVVSDPHKENDGTKDAYVSYLITTNVRANLG